MKKPEATEINVREAVARCLKNAPDRKGGDRQSSKQSGATAKDTSR